MVSRINDLVEERNYFEKKKCEYFNEWNLSHLDNIRLKKENEQLKQDILNLKISIMAKETLIDVCEKKFKELGYIITVDDDGYVIE